MSNHLLKCQVVFRKMRRIAPLRMLETGLEKMFLSPSEQLSCLFRRRMCCTQGFAIKVCLHPRKQSWL